MKTTDPSSIVFFWAFLILGIIALIGAIFYDAPHHYWTASLCGVVALVNAREFKKFKQSKK